MQPLHVLAVDDSPSFREYLAEILRGDGHIVTQATSGEEAIEHYRAQKPDLILMDRIMTGVDEFLLKPLNPLHLQIRLQSVMRIAAIQRSTNAVPGVSRGIDACG